MNTGIELKLIQEAQELCGMNEKDLRKMAKSVSLGKGLKHAAFQRAIADRSKWDIARFIVIWKRAPN